jgi:Flp pilus assembly pilin Flp
MLQVEQFRREDGQTMAEYGVVLAVITAAALGALTLLSTNVGGALTRVAALVGVGNG